MSDGTFVDGAGDPATCKVTGCPRTVVGNSTTGDGHVCRKHNEEEWGRALERSDTFESLGSELRRISDSRP